VSETAAEARTNAGDAAEIASARDQTHNNSNSNEVRDCAVRLAAPLTPHSLYTITIHTNQPVLPTIPTQHTPETHTKTQPHTKHTSHKSPIIPPPYTTSHTLIVFHTSSYSQSCHNITTPTHHRHTNPTQTHTPTNTPHSPKDNLAPTHTQP
jgi:hypothetical protein